MSERGKVRRARKEARQEQQGRKVVKWIFIVLLLLALAMWIFSIYTLS